MYRLSDIVIEGGVLNNTARGVVPMDDPLAFYNCSLQKRSSVVLQNDMT
jgi:hypothetical protein